MSEPTSKAEAARRFAALGDPRRLTLVTCFPFDALRAGGPQRYVVFAFESRNRGGERGTRG